MKTDIQREGRGERREEVNAKVQRRKGAKEEGIELGLAFSIEMSGDRGEWASRSNTLLTEAFSQHK